MGTWIADGEPSNRKRGDGMRVMSVMNDTFRVYATNLPGLKVGCTDESSDHGCTAMTNVTRLNTVSYSSISAAERASMTARTH